MAHLSGTGATSLYVILCVVALLLVSRLFERTRAIPKGIRLPPGPRGNIFMGNAKDMPTHQGWLTFSHWAKVYGDIFHIKVFGQSMVFISSMEIAYDLFEKRSSIYSDRCEFPMLNDLMGFSWNFGFMRYGQFWRRHRKLFHLKFHPAAAAEYHSVQTKLTRDLLRNLYQTPNKFVGHISYTAVALIMEIIYGIETSPKDDPYIKTAENAMAAFIAAGNPGAFLVDTLPILKHVHEWIPGAGFRKKARIWRQWATEMSVAPFAAVKDALNAGTAKPSFTASLLEEASRKSDTPLDEEDVIRGAGSTAYAAGSDTTVSAIHTFILGALLNPEIQVKAQAELDKVVGPDRLPEFEDRESLPYINAICKETYRWHPVLPLGMAHYVAQDDIYGDYLIPKGSIVVGNAWHLLHDEANFGPETEKFKPERFLVPGAKDPAAAFGFGRRICPGRYVADNSVWIAVASILHAFNITPARDNSGREIFVSPSFTSGFMSHPEPFQCSFTPRSDSAARLLLQHGNE